MIRGKVNYNREIVKDCFYKEKLKLKEYDDIDSADLYDWLNRLFKKHGDQVKIEVSVWEESAGCGVGPSYVHLIPFLTRLEDDKEYNKRIKEEEEELKERQERERLIQEEREQYKKDLAEYERIKNKYHF